MQSIKRVLASLFASALLLAPMTSAQAQTTNDEAFAKFLGNYGSETLPEAWAKPSKREEETHEVRAARIQMIADLTVEEAGPAAREQGWFWSESDLAMAAFTKMWYESGRFSLKVHNGTFRGDHRKSVCLGQIMFGGERLVGTDRESTRRCIDAVMKHLIMHQKRCLNPKTPPSSWAVAKVFSGYGTGYSCSESVWNPVKDANGNDALDKNGKPIKDFWALKRGYTWWQMRKATQTK